MPENVPLIGSRVVRTLLLFAIIALIGQSFLGWVGSLIDALVGFIIIIEWSR